MSDDLSKPGPSEPIQTAQRRGLAALFQGKAKEKTLAGLFEEWLWTTAEPSPDVGADLIVDIPAVDDIAPASFAVQIRSNTQKVRTLVIERPSALRLQASVLPAFAMAVHKTSRQVRWALLEPLFDTEESFLQGGDLKVRLIDSQAFSIDADDCPADLLTVIQQAKARGALKAVPTMLRYADASEERYRQIDPALRARPSFAGEREVLTIEARGAPVAVQLHLGGPTPGKTEALRKAFEFGRPAAIHGDDIKFAGSPLFDHLQRTMGVGTLHLIPEPVWEGQGWLTTPSPAAGLSPVRQLVDVRMTRGSMGGEVVVTAGGGTVRMAIRIDGHDASSADLQVDHPRMKDWTLEDLQRTSNSIRLLDSMRHQEVLELELLDFVPPVGCIRFQWGKPDTAFDELDYPLRAASALHQVAAARGWALPAKPLAGATRGDCDSWLTAHLLDTRQAVSLPSEPFALTYAANPGVPYDAPKNGHLVMPYSVNVTCGNQLLGTVDAWLRCRSFSIAWVLENGGPQGKVEFKPIGMAATMELLPDSDEPPDL